MKLTNGEILNAKGPLGELVQQKFPVKTSLELVRLVQKLNEFLIPIETVRDGLVTTYGKPSETNAQSFEIRPGDENWPKFSAELAELVTQEVEVVFKKVQLPETLEIEPAVVMALDKFITI